MTGSRWILLRGLARESAHWGEFAQELRHRLNASDVLSMDLPGTGTDYQATSPAAVSAIVDLLRTRRDGYRPGVTEPWHLLGISLGGMAALHWAQRFPDEVAGVALINASAANLSPFWQRLRLSALLPLIRTMLTRDVTARESQILGFTTSLPVTAEAIAIRRQIYLQRPIGIATVARQLWSAAGFTCATGPLNVPALVIAGGGDRLVDPACSKALARALSVPFICHPSGGHDLPLDAPCWLLNQLEVKFAG